MYVIYSLSLQAVTQHVFKFCGRCPQVVKSHVTTEITSLVIITATVNVKLVKGKAHVSRKEIIICMLNQTHKIAKVIPN